MKESQILIVMETENMNKVIIKAEYLTESSSIYFSFKCYDFRSLPVFFFFLSIS